MMMALPDKAPLLLLLRVDDRKQFQFVFFVRFFREKKVKGIWTLCHFFSTLIIGIAPLSRNYTRTSKEQIEIPI